MYVPAHFAAPADALEHLLAVAPLADLITPGPDGLVATPLPLLFVPGDPDGSLVNGSLQGHVARNNPHWQAAGSGSGESLAILRGPDAYVSPNSYATKAEHGRVVPTWNYLTVHVYGTLVAHDDPDWTGNLVRRLTDRFEAAQPAPWSADDAPVPYFNGQVRAIVGVELLITRIEAKYKLSQNRSAGDVAGVVTTLAAGTPTEQAVSLEMRAAETRAAEMRAGGIRAGEMRATEIRG